MDDRDQYRSTIDRWIEGEKGETLGPASAARYAEFHHGRFRETLRICKRFLPDQSAAVLDVGRSEFTSMLAEYYGTVWSLGYGLEQDQGGHRETGSISRIPHVEFDLSDSDRCDKWPSSPCAFDLITFCETIEHLSTAPEFTLLMLSSMLKPGGFILVTTPNAAALSKRIKMLGGRNPFEKIRFFPGNPGHFREYTRNELVDMGKLAGLRASAALWTNYSLSGGRTALRLLTSFLPSLRYGLVVVFQKPG